MLSESTGFHRLIAKIYETAANPDLWPELLDAFVECVDLELATDDDVPTRLDDHTASLESLPFVSSSLTLALRRIPRFIPDARDDGEPQAIDVDAVGKILLQHFKSALNVAQRLVDYEENKEVLASVLDRLPIALLVVDANGRVLESNPQAQKIAEQASGIIIRNSQLLAVTPEAQEKLSGAILRLARKAAASQDNLALTLPVSDKDRGYILAFLSPVKGSADSNGLSNVAVFLSWPKSQPFTVPRAISDLYALTPVETEIISMLVRGYCIKEIASAREVSEHTIRSQVKSVLAKTRTARQSDLLKLVLCGPASTLHTDLEQAHNLADPHLADGSTLLKLADGRTLAYKEYGEANGEPLIYLHSVLGGRLEFDCFGAELAQQTGFRVISPDRPGFGLSDPYPSESFLHWANDVAQLADELCLEQFSLAGYAMGGVFACAIAHTLSQRIKRVLLISTGVRAQTREDFAGMMPLYRMANKLARDFPQIAHLVNSLTLKSAQRNPKRFFERLAADLPATEAKLFESEAFRAAMFHNFTDSLQQGFHHVSQEVDLLVRPWDFDLQAIRAPVDLWHGRKDRNVTCILSEKMADVLPHASLTVLPEHGHYLIYQCMPDILHAFRQKLATPCAITAKRARVN